VSLLNSSIIISTSHHCRKSPGHTCTSIGTRWIRTDREPLVPGGHERSCSASRVRRSQAVARYDQGRRSSVGRGPNPSVNCRGPAALANQAGVTEDGPHRPAELMPSLPGPSHVHPHGRAPDVP
jgi:hypothetical protein